MTDIVEELAKVLHEAFSKSYADSLEKEDSDVQEMWKNDARQVLLTLQPHIEQKQREAWDACETEHDSCREEILTFKGWLASQKGGLVASAMRRQGLDPDKAESNKAEVTALSGRRFEDDVEKGKV